MAPHNHKDSFKEVIGIFKEGYNASSKTFVWAKVFNEWGRVGVGVLILLGFISIVFIAIFSQSHQQQTLMNQAVQNLSPALNDTVKFIDVGKRSLEKREEILRDLMEATNVSYGQLMSQKDIKNKLILLSALLENCREARRTFVEALSRGKNPLLNPDISDSFKDMTMGEEETLSFSRERPSIITLQEENRQWENLCWLCEQETKRTKTLLQSASQ